MPALVSAALGYFYNAPYWQIALLAAGIFVLVYFVISASVLLWRRTTKNTFATPPPTVSPKIEAQEWWRERIEEWRSVIHNFDFDRERFASTDTYSQMKQYLRSEVIDMFEAQRTLHVGNEARGDTTYKYTLLDEVDRIEGEQVFNAPEPITNHATSGELRALCFHLADELEHEDLMYKDREVAIQIWIPDLREKGFSESEINEKITSAQDDNVMQSLKRYNKHHKGRLLGLYDALGPRGWFSPADRHRFENLYDPYDMRRLAKRLREVCNKLPEG